MDEKENILIYINRIDLKFKAFLSICLLLGYILQLHLLFDSIQYFAMMILAIPAIVSAGLLGVKFGFTISLFAIAYTFGFGYFVELEFWTFFGKFSPGLFLTMLLVLFVGKIHELTIHYAAEIEKRLFAEKEIEKKNNELQLYADRLKNEIEEKFSAEQTLKKSEEQYRTIVEKSGIAMLIDDAEGNLKYFNKQLSELTLYSEEELKNISFKDLIHADDYDRIVENHNKKMMGEFAHNRFEFKAIRKDKTIIYLEADVSVLKEKGEIYGTRAYIWDITSRKHAELALKESEERFRSIYNNASMGFYRMLPSGEIIMVNPSFCKMLKLNSPEEILFKKVEDVLEVDTQRNEFVSNLMNEKKVNGMELEWYRKDGGLFYGRETAWCIFDEAGEVVYIDAILEDVTLRKQVEQEREQLISLLQSAKSEIKVLSGLLPICSSCKKIRDEVGQWSNVEQYIDEHSEAEFSHGICPECAARLYPGYL